MSGTDVYRVSANFYRILESDWPCGPLIGFYCFFSLSLGKLIGFSSVALELKIAAAASPSRQRKKMFSDVPAVHNQARHVIFSFVFRPRRTGFFLPGLSGFRWGFAEFHLDIGPWQRPMGDGRRSFIDFRFFIFSFFRFSFLALLFFTYFYRVLHIFTGL